MSRASVPLAVRKKPRREKLGCMVSPPVLQNPRRKSAGYATHFMGKVHLQPSGSSVQSGAVLRTRQSHSGKQEASSPAVRQDTAHRPTFASPPDNPPNALGPGSMISAFGSVNSVDMWEAMLHRRA